MACIAMINTHSFITNWAIHDVIVSNKNRPPKKSIVLMLVVQGEGFEPPKA